MSCCVVADFLCFHDDDNLLSLVESAGKVDGVNTNLIANPDSLGDFGSLVYPRDGLLSPLLIFDVVSSIYWLCYASETYVGLHPIMGKLFT